MCAQLTTEFAELSGVTKVPSDGGAPISSTPASKNYQIELEEIAEFKSKAARLSRVSADQDRSPA